MFHPDHRIKNGEYELFFYDTYVRCFDLQVEPIVKYNEAMHDWLAAQPKELCRMLAPPYHRSAYYVKPALMTKFLLRWS